MSDSPSEQAAPSGGLLTSFSARSVLTNPLIGPLAALIVAIIIFSLLSDSFLSATNFSLILQQSVVIGILAVAQTLIILTAGIDLSIGAFAVLGTIVLAKVATDGSPVMAVLACALVLLVLGAANGALVAFIRLPPFIVTLGSFTAIYAATQLYAGSQTYAVEHGSLTILGNRFSMGPFTTTWGVVTLIVLYVLVWFVLSQTAAGRHIYAVGGSPEAARLSGIRSQRVLMGVYIAAGLIAVVAAWAAIGRIPNADPNAYYNANLETITAVVIGGTSLFGGRGGVLGSLIGTLIVSVLRNGLTLAGVDNLYQNVATGCLVIIAVSLDQFSRRRS